MALYLPKHNLGFIHIPKTGGTSMSNWLKQFNYRWVGVKHDSADVLLAKHPNAKYFTVCRNPYSRVVSWYNFRIMRHKYLIEHENNKNFPGCKDPNLTNEYALNEHYGNNFDEWLKKIDWKSPEGYNLDYGLLRNQVEYLSKKKKPEFILKQESLNEDSKIVAELLGIKDSFIHVNIGPKGKHLDWRPYYKSDFAREYVYKHWKKDFEYFNYEREIKW